MSSFKPLNSNENNLHIIRASTDNTGTIVKPTINQLPPSFTITPTTGGTYAYLTVSYPLVYNSSDVPSVFISATNMNVTSKTTNSCVITSTTASLYSTDIAIIGTRSSGPIFAVSNRGWKYSSSLTNNNLLYSDMLVGINTDNPTFNLSTAGNIGFTPYETPSSQLVTSQLLNNYLNIISLDANSTVSLPQASQDGQLLNLTIGNILISNYTVTLNTSSNILNNVSSNIQLSSVGDTVSLCSYNNAWLIINQSIKPPVTLVNPAIQYNQVNASTYSFNSIINGKLTVLNLNANLTINLPVTTDLDGYVIEIVVGNVSNMSSVSFLNGNIINNPTIGLSNISDKIKLLGTVSGWLVI